MPTGKLTEVHEEVLGRAGRFRPVHTSLEVKEVVVGEGERRRRYIVCRNVVEAARQRQHREEVLTALRQELARLDPQAPDHTKRACELVASKRYGRYLSRGPGGQLAIDAEAVRRAARMDGKYVLLTNDDTLSPEDVGLGYKAMMIIEACFRRMKTTGLRIRPVYHWTAHRITSHSKLCVLALLIERAAEDPGRGYLAQPAVCPGGGEGCTLPGPWAHTGAEHALDGASDGLPQKARRKAPSAGAFD